ncbi:hypothetical protein GY21_12715 [Cryobacterium roopkundense]|uniref:Cyclic-di-GMP-binding biofilm dispersal mediator protein n=1 Tax=Cryobacterium roopkundense TaxID=1001240 RepID=A0A099J3E4_9MICO|nr:SDR family NAD(P)-dependent oxidoreductase [Cryobacterium roopkundense]KGJ72856.1 hypothetical protein GY21_12715 [Cryobacterium roopkundense]MBB5641182.1 cyclic-di-GMP-binding biofilm dispersal mediator protein [Cryobacterium roopkundense]
MTAIAGSSILVIGATGGLGRELSRLLAERGALLVLSGRSEAGLASLDVPGARVVADVSDPVAVAALVREALAVSGRLDGIINAAGVVAFGPASELTDETLTELFLVNALAPMRVLREAVPALAESAAAGREPFVLTLSGVVSESPTAHMAAYSASKAAVAAFVQATARELRRTGIRVIDARPGHTETALSTHPLAGTAPRLPAGYPPASVALRIVQAIESGEKDLPSTAFASLTPAAS